MIEGATTSRASSWIWLSVAAAVVTIILKSWAAHVSQSVGFLSDAIESGVNLIAAIVTLLALRWSEAPPDREHSYGHAKGELLAALFEGLLVFVAGLAIIATSVERLVHPTGIASVSLGVVLSGIAAAINGAVGATLVRVGRKNHSTALEADGHHLLSDVWTSVAVIVGLGLAHWTGAVWLDPVGAGIVALLVLRTGLRILRSAIGGLVDTELAPQERAALDRALAPFRERDVEFRAIQTRVAGRQAFVHLTVRVPGDWSVDRAHSLADRVEEAIGNALSLVTVDTHIEPLPAAMENRLP